MTESQPDEKVIKAIDAIGDDPLVTKLALFDQIDKTLAKNDRLTTLAIVMTVAIFLLGVAFIGLGLYLQNILYTLPATVMGGLLYWPINTILKIRKENLALGIGPALIVLLPPREAADAITRLLEWLHG